MSFAQLGLSEPLIKTITKQNYSNPTAIQSEAIPTILAGHDLIASAPTGTGKTASFVLPILEQLLNKPATKTYIRALIITPTRELAAQVHKNIQTYGKLLPFKACAIFGGAKIIPQINQLKKANDIVIATPGRLLDLVKQRVINLSHVETLVLDEADRMLDMGFLPDIKRILTLLPNKRQNLLFSATFSASIKALANSFLQAPKTIKIAHQANATSKITQVIHPVDQARKSELLSYLIGSKNWTQVLVFTRTKHGADRLTKKLEKDGLKSTAIHGNKTQGARSRALANFKSGKVRVLVATDVASRGLDIDKLPYVVNFDLPTAAEDYVHRIGRTGRAMNSGVAISLVSSNEAKILNEIEHLLKFKIKHEIVPDFEPSEPIKTEKKPSKRRRRPTFKKRKTANPNQAQRAKKRKPSNQAQGAKKRKPKKMAR